mmetsp:Transcript_71391/g.197132  ORF Transcript_71391/g.197132 Transcript_71391/m.197132 type:complete len:277 (+) Transcript_71391:907-1737(+)
MVEVGHQCLPVCLPPRVCFNLHRQDVAVLSTISFPIEACSTCGVVQDQAEGLCVLVAALWQYLELDRLLVYAWRECQGACGLHIVVAGLGGVVLCVVFAAYLAGGPTGPVDDHPHPHLVGAFPNFDLLLCESQFARAVAVDDHNCGFHGVAQGSILHILQVDIELLGRLMNLVFVDGDVECLGTAPRPKSKRPTSLLIVLALLSRATPRLVAHSDGFLVVVRMDVHPQGHLLLGLCNRVVRCIKSHDRIFSRACAFPLTLQQVGHLPPAHPLLLRI